MALIGMEGHPIDVECSITSGLPAFTIVGLPDPSIMEARERVRAAIISSGESWPQQRITVNLSPANLRKTGSSFDLAMALALLVANERLEQRRLDGVRCVGELSLDGSVRRVRGVLPSVIAAADAGARAVIVPAGNAREAAVVRGVEVYGVEHLREAAGLIAGELALRAEPHLEGGAHARDDELDLSDVRGNIQAKEAVEIAAAGGHNLLLIGPPGGGKTMLARRVPSVMPPMTEQESFEVTKIHSVAGLLDERTSLVRARPFRAPHHSGSLTGLVGGGSAVPIPGEVTLAHRGVLFLDEYGEFRREALQALRQPLEDGSVTIVRSRWAVRFPARVQLVAATNPCPCGFGDDPVMPCGCLPGRIALYRERLSGPILDRIDLQVHVQRLTRHELFGAAEGEPSHVVAERVARAREIQRARLEPLGIGSNAEVPARGIERTCLLEHDARDAVGAAIEGLHLSARGAHRLIRVARTMADLRQRETVTADDIARACAYRLGESDPVGASA